MLDTQAEQMLPLAKLAREVPSRRRSGRGVQPSTVWRWTTKGIKGIRLESAVIGGIRFSSREALHRFFAATTAAADGITAPPVVRTKRQREAAIAAAEKELATA
jgi:hypothetical protein